MTTVTLYARPGVMGLTHELGEINTSEDGTIEVPERLVEVCLTHGYCRSAAEARDKPKKINSRPVLESKRKSPSEQVADATYFELKDYCAANGVEVAPKTPTADLRELVLNHMEGGA